MAFTKIVPAGINTGGSYTLQDLDVVGVLTAASISGPLSGDATGLAGTPNITVGVVTAASATISGDLTVNGTTTTLDTVLTEVDKLEVGANNTTVGVAITQSGTGDILRLYDGATQVVAVKNGGNIGIGTDDPDGKLNIYSTNLTRVVIEGDGSSTASSALVLKSNDSNSNYRATGVFYYDTTSQTEWFSGRPYTGSDTFAIHRKTNLGGSTGNTTAHPDNTLFLINSSGNIGIGSHNPGVILDVREKKTAGSTQIRLYNTDNSNTTTQTAEVSLTPDSRALAGAGIKAFKENADFSTNANRDISLALNVVQNNSQTEALRITSSGNLGIGTITPTDKLHVYSSNGNTVSTIDSVGNDAALQLRNSGDGNWSGINFIRERSTGTNVTGGSIWMPSVTANNSALLYIQTQSASANAGADGALVDNNGVRLKLASQPNGVAADTAFSVELGSQERFRISSTGLVGIGTDNPDHRLTVYDANSSPSGGILVQNALYSSNLNRPYLIAGTKNYDGTTTDWGTFGFQHRIKSNSGGTSRVTIDTVNGEGFCVDNSGDVGIGTDNPIMRLHVHGAANSAESRIRLSSAEGSGLTIRAQSATENNINADSGEDITFSAGNTETLRIDSDGNVTIPNIPLIKTNMGNVYGSAGSLTASPQPASAILQSAAEIDRGDNGWTTSGTNAYTFVCPVTGIYAVHAHMSLNDITQGNRIIFTMAYTAGGGDLPLDSYVEVMDVNMDDYMNYSYYNTWNFTAGTRVGFGLNGVSGTVSGINSQWGIHLIA